jgi:alpha-galactosidase
MTKPINPKLIQIAYIGGGSRLWARYLMGDLALCPDLGGEVLLYDTDTPAAQLNERFGNWIQTQPGVVSNWSYRAVATLAEALAGADLVVISIQPGPLEMMGHEIAVAEKYGLFFPVGDTTGVPGLMRGLRSASIFAGFAEAITEHCPETWVINYTNPMSVCTRTLTRISPGLKVFGCCHEMFGTQEVLAEVAKGALNLDLLPPREEIAVNVLGINHFTWIDRATYQGIDLLALLRDHIAEPGVLHPFSREEVEAQNDWFVDNRQIKYELFRRFGILAAAGDRHLAEFVPGFTGSPEILFRWGVICTPVSYRIQVWENSPKMVLAWMEGREPLSLQESGEETVRQIKALLGLDELVTNVNMENRGQVANLPLRAVVETNAQFSLDQVQPLTAGELPPGVKNLTTTHVDNQEMIIEAALNGDADLAFQAILNDPMTNLPVDEAWAMFNEIGFPEGL